MSAFEVGKEAVLVVGVEGVVKAVDANNVTIGDYTMPYRFDHAGGVRYLSLLWPQDDPANCDRDCCKGPVEDAAEDARDDLRELVDAIRDDHLDRHIPGPMRFCEFEACRDVDRLVERLVELPR